MALWLEIPLAAIAFACTAVILFGVYVDHVRRRRMSRELDRRARPFPPSIFDRRNPLHPTGTPPVSIHIDRTRHLDSTADQRTSRLPGREGSSG